MNIALPSAQADLGFSDADRQWVVTAYTLAFGGLLLLGGRIADLLGRKRTFLIGLVGFAAASALGGAATGSGMLFARPRPAGRLRRPARARGAVAADHDVHRAQGARQGVRGLRRDRRRRQRDRPARSAALLTEYLDWRWCLYVNVLFALAALVGAPRLPARPLGRARQRLDVPGTLLGYRRRSSPSCTASAEAEDAGWSAGPTLALFVASAVLLAAFVWWQSRAEAPLLPLRIVNDRNRAGVSSASGSAIIGMFGPFLFLTYYLQQVLRLPAGAAAAWPSCR